MELHVILGPPGSGKSGRAVDEVRAAARAGEDAFLVVPGSVDRIRFLRELAASGATLGVEVGTFDQLVARLAGSPPVRRTDRAMERILVRDAMRGVPELGGAAEWSGFVDTARLHIDRLRRARVWGGQELEAAMTDLPGGDPDAWCRLETRVGELLAERSLHDDAWFEARAARAVGRGGSCPALVAVHGFATLPPTRVRLVERLAERGRVVVTLPWRPGRRVHERAAELRDRWRARGAFVEELEGEPGSHAQLDALADELFEDSVTSSTPGRAQAAAARGLTPVAFVDCCGPLQEAEEVVREVAALAASGLAWGDIAVASARAELDADVLGVAFERAGIPARAQLHRTALDVPAGRALHDVVAAACGGDLRALVAAMRAPVLGGVRSVVDAAELELRRAGARDRSALRRPRVAAALPEPVRALLDVGPRAGNALDAFRAVLAGARPADVGELDLLRGIAASLDGVAVAAGGAANVGLVDVRDTIAAFPLSVPDRSDAGAVVIASLEDLRSTRYEAVVLRSTHLGGFRVRADQEEDAPAAARDALHVAVTSARSALRVVRQAAGSDGGELAPSPAWSELWRRSPGAPLRVRRLGDVVVQPSDVRLEHEVGAAVAMAEGAGTTVDAVPAGVQIRVGAVRRRSRSSRLAGPLADELAAVRTLTVTELETYATCSAKWFIDRRLRVPDPDEDTSRLADGTLAHALLQQLAPDVRSGAVSMDQAREQASELAPRLAAQIRGADLDAARIERITWNVLQLLAAEEEWARPDVVEVERSFGRDTPGSIGPGLDVDGVEVVGRIDRIDRYGSDVVLHDYKYRSTGWSASSLLPDRRLQLLVYWLALEQSGAPGRPIGGVYRAVTAAGAVSGVLSPELRELGMVGQRQRAGVLDVEEREELLVGAAELTRSAVQGLRRGVVEPLATTAGCPAHCRLQTICRVGESGRSDPRSAGGQREVVGA